mmetsp:Transcript_22905/g.66193  ORF Transcript_22905/g.66193 Transcript_22905/m.66193 type:complete len:242 (-) Transcript_22905:183-908(-)
MLPPHSSAVGGERLLQDPPSMLPSDLCQMGDRLFRRRHKAFRPDIGVRHGQQGSGNDFEGLRRADNRRRAQPVAVGLLRHSHDTAERPRVHVRRARRAEAMAVDDKVELLRATAHGPDGRLQHTNPMVDGGLGVQRRRGVLVAKVDHRMARGAASQNSQIGLPHRDPQRGEQVHVFPAPCQHFGEGPCSGRHVAALTSQINGHCPELAPVLLDLRQGRRLGQQPQSAIDDRLALLVQAVSV